MGLQLWSWRLHCGVLSSICVTYWMFKRRFPSYWVSKQRLVSVREFQPMVICILLKRWISPSQPPPLSLPLCLHLVQSHHVPLRILVIWALHGTHHLKHPADRVMATTVCIMWSQLFYVSDWLNSSFGNLVSRPATLLYENPGEF